MSAATELVPYGTKLVTCHIDTCTRPLKARGLCATHYARWRRTGNAEKVRRAGRPANPWMTSMRQLLGSDFGSERTFARYFRTRRIFAEMRAAGYECDENEALRLSTRANGTLNISRLERIVEAQLIFAVLKDGDS